MYKVTASRNATSIKKKKINKGRAIQFFFFFFICPHKGRGREIRTCDIYFIRRDSQLIELPLGDGRVIQLLLNLR
jgi:hypothetical protein